MTHAPPSDSTTLCSHPERNCGAPVLVSSSRLQVWAATTPTALPPGAYLQDCNVAGTAKVGVSTRLGARLWAWTDAATKGFVPKETEAGQPFRWADPQPPALQAANGTAH